MFFRCVFYFNSLFLLGIALDHGTFSGMLLNHKVGVYFIHMLFLIYV